MFEKPCRTLSTDYTGRCGNCHECFSDDEEKYCTYCGTKRGEGKFEPYDNAIYCIYGPMPEKRTRECLKCGNQWTYTGMLDRHKYCTKCGAPSKLLQSTFNRLRFVDTGVLYTPALVHINAINVPCCNRLIPANFEFCPFCGKEIAKAIIPEIDPIIVDMEERKWNCKCGQASPMRYRYCGLCGKSHV